MWKYTTNVHWDKDSEAVIKSEGKSTWPFTPPVEFGGKPGAWTPEDLLVGAVDACLHLTVMHFVKQMGIGLTSYTSKAVGELEKQAAGLRFTGINIHIDAELSSQDDVEKMKKAVEQGEKYCPVGAAVRVPVTVSLEAKVNESKAA